MGICSDCGRLGIVRRVRAGPLAAICLACLAAFHGVATGGLFGHYDGPDEVVGYGDEFITASGSGMSPYWYDGPTYVSRLDLADAEDAGTLVVRFPPDSLE